MSLLDSFLLEPPLQVDVWIAIRTDGVRGTGTQNDPYDGSVRAQPLISVTSLTRDTDPTIAVAQTGGVNHGYVASDWVAIAGATGTGAAYYNGSFRLLSTTPTSFKYKMSQDPGASASGAVTCQLDPRLFDAWMNRAGTHTTIHLGPGIFETRGYGEAVYGWQPRDGQRILGSGMGVTVLKLVGAAYAYSKYYVIGNGYFVTPFEASDFTVDCNFPGQSISGYVYPPISCAGVFIQGAYTRLRRIQAINFGSLDPTLECFVLWSAGADPSRPEAVDCVIEDCIIEQPAINNYAINTCLAMGCMERATDGVMGYHRACVIRNCVVDCEYRENPVAISQITFSGTTATVNTVVPHGRVVNDWVRISGARVSGLSDPADNPFNGSFKIISATSTTFQYTLASTPSAAPTGDMWVGRFSSHIVSVTGLTATQVPMTNDWEVGITASPVAMSPSRRCTSANTPLRQRARSIMAHSKSKRLRPGIPRS